MGLEFGKTKYKMAATLLISKSQHEDNVYSGVHTVPEAFMLLIKNLGEDELDNLCSKLKKRYPSEDCYNLTQGKGECFEKNPDITRMIIYTCALECLKEGKNMGTKLDDNKKYNTTAWVNHSLYEAKLAGEFAAALGLDIKTAQTLGLLHDIGRKKTHTFEHTIEGFKILVDEGWIKEAPITLTHSYLNGIGTKSFDLTEGKIPIINENGEKVEGIGYRNDIETFVEEYKYSEYDTVISIADLMTLPTGIQAPLDRIKDLIERKHPDYSYRSEFLSEFINTLNEYLRKFGHITEYEMTNKNQGLAELMVIFEKVSTEFYDYYCKKIKEQSFEGEGR